MTEFWRERLTELIKSSGIAPKALSLKAGLSETFVRDFLQRGQAPNVANLVKLCAALGVDPSVLFEDAETRDFIRKHPGATQRTIHGQAIPEIDARAGAGGGGVRFVENAEADGNGNTITIEGVSDLWGVPDRFVREELRGTAAAIRIFPILGDSMSPTLNSGDRVFVDTTYRFPSPPGVYAVWDGYGVVVKRVEIVPRTDPARVILISDNNNHKQYELTLEEAHILGRVVGRISLM